MTGIQYVVEISDLDDQKVLGTHARVRGFTPQRLPSEFPNETTEIRLDTQTLKVSMTGGDSKSLNDAPITRILVSQVSELQELPLIGICFCLTAVKRLECNEFALLREYQIHASTTKSGTTLRFSDIQSGITVKIASVRV